MLGVGINLWRTSLIGGGVIVDDRVITSFSVTAPATATAGVPANVTVRALDQHGALYSGYAGTVHFTSTDGAAILPADATLNAFGFGIFPVAFHTIGNQTVTVADVAVPAATGTSAAVAVSAGVPTGTYLQLSGASGYLWLSSSTSRIKLSGT